MLTVIIVMTIGIGIGLAYGNRPKLTQKVDKLISYAIYLLLFLLGISVGLNDTIVNNLHTIGLNALWITIGAVLGSLLVSWAVYRIWFSSLKAKEESHEG